MLRLRLREGLGNMLTENFQVDEFTLEVDDGWVHLLDGEKTVRLSMPQDIWNDLIKKYMSK